MKKFVQGCKAALAKAVDFVKAEGAKALAIGAVVAGAAVSTAHASTDAIEIATNAQTAFGVIAPITITIAGFYVILRIAKRVVH